MSEIIPDLEVLKKWCEAADPENEESWQEFADGCVTFVPQLNIIVNSAQSVLCCHVLNMKGDT